MKLRYRRETHLPKLAWCADVDLAAEAATVRHGDFVEVHDDFFVEGVWNGSFEAGQFAATECIFGSGGLRSGDEIVFVTSCSTTDALFHHHGSGHVVVSNSLPFLLAAVGDELDPSYQSYFEHCESLIRGINDYERDVVTRNGTVQRLLFRNLRVSPDGVHEEDKPLPPAFVQYQDYRDYLERNYAAIAANVRSALRRHRLSVFSTQSRGYDSTAINALAARHGIDRVFTSPRAKSIDPFDEARDRQQQNDDGSEICAALGLECLHIDRKSHERDGFVDEYLFYATQAANQDANLRGIHQHIETPAVLHTGVLGEIWYDEAGYAQWPGYVTPELKRFDVSGHGLSEIRLRVGYIQMALPFMGAQRREDICRISNSVEMKPWQVNPGYDRPIPRRIAEEGGVPRQLFGQVKMGSVVIFPKPPLPYGRGLRQEFFDYLVANGVISRWRAWVWPAVQVLNSMLECRSPRRFRVLYYLERGIARLVRRPFQFRYLWTRYNGALFCFSVNKCVAEYSAWGKEHAHESHPTAVRVEGDDPASAANATRSATLSGIAPRDLPSAS